MQSGVLEPYIGYYLVELYDVYVRFFRSQTHLKLMNLNLTQWRTLTHIRFNPDHTQRALATAVGIDPSSMTPIVDVFESRGWVRRIKSKTNRSAYEMRMTPSGLKAYQSIEREIGHAEALFAQVIGASDRKTLLSILQKLHDRLEREL